LAQFLYSDFFADHFAAVAGQGCVQDLPLEECVVLDQWCLLECDVHRLHGGAHAHLGGQCAGPLLTALIARIFIGHKLPARTWGAIAVACAGMAYMFEQQLDLKQGGAALGMAVAFCVPVAAAVHWTVVQRAQAHGEQLDFVPCVLIGGVISSLVTLPLAFPFQATGSDVAWLGLLGLVQLAIPCTLAVICAKVLKAPEVSLLALLEVIFGILLAWMFAGEVPTQAVIIGGTLVIGALVANEFLAWKST
jgi:drug/metabolite transporter (DMT)-like permease